MSYLQSSRDFIATTIPSIAKATTVVHPTDFVSQEIEVSDVESIRLQGRVTGGNASATGVVTFSLLASLDGAKWDTVAFKTLAITMVGAAEIVQSDVVDVSGFQRIRLQSILNADASYTATLVNLKWGKSYGGVL